MRKYNDRYNAALLYELQGECFRYVRVWNRFLVWDGQTWIPDLKGESYMLNLTEGVVEKLEIDARKGDDDGDDEKANKRAKAWAEKSGNLRSRQAMIGSVKSIRECHAEPRDFDQNKLLLTCANGTLDLATGKFRESRPEDMLTSKCEVTYDAKAKCPTWERYLREALPDPEVQAFMKRWLGYCLTGHVKERKFVVCWGEQGNNGKSLMFGILRALLGDKYAWNAQPKLLLSSKYQEHSTIYASLCGKRVCMISEINEGRAWDSANVKVLTGGDTVTCRRMNEDEWVFDPTHKIMVATNPKPRVNETSDAFWNRLVLVPFEVSFTGEREDKQLKEKLMAELPGILNWMVEGCVEWQKGGLQVPQQLTAAAQTYRDDEDQLGSFMAQCFIFEPGATMEAAELTKLIGEWNKKNEPHVWAQSVAPRLRQAGAKQTRSKNTRGWVGVRVRTPEDGEWVPGDRGDTWVPGDVSPVKGTKPLN